MPFSSISSIGASLRRWCESLVIQARRRCDDGWLRTRLPVVWVDGHIVAGGLSTRQSNERLPFATTWNMVRTCVGPFVRWVIHVVPCSVDGSTRRSRRGGEFTSARHERSVPSLRPSRSMSRVRSVLPRWASSGRSQQDGVTRAVLYKWKKQLLGSGYDTSPPKKPPAGSKDEQVQVSVS